MTVKAGGIDHQPWHIVDIMPTVLEAVGAKRPDADAKGRPIPAADGVSMLPVLRGGAVPARAPLCFEHKGNWAIIDGGWKLVGEGQPKGGGHDIALYDYAKDRAESRNVAAQHPDQVARLRGLWEAWAKRVDANDAVK
jgi:arylsulfatase